MLQENLWGKNVTEKTLNRLLSDSNFIELDISLKKYNVFRALKVQDYEIRHSKFLGHLLNPSETHGLGSEFLTNFLLCLSNSTGKALDISQLDLDLAEIKMEWSVGKNGNFEAMTSDTVGSDKNKRLDILIRVPQRYVENAYYNVAIEMKWRAKQHKGQLVAYTKQLTGAGIKPNISALLTVDGDDPEQEAQTSWQGVTYQDVVVPALRNTLHKQLDSTSQKVIYTIEDWLDILIDETSEESSRQSAAEAHCDKLLGYKSVLEANSAFLSVKYQPAYEKLKRYIEEDEDTRGKVLKSFKKTIKEQNFVAAYSNRTYLRFYPSQSYPFPQNIGGFPSQTEGLSYPLIWEILVWEAGDKMKLRLVLTLAKLDERFTVDQRQKIAEKIRQEFPKPKWDRTEGAITNNWTRIIRSKWELSEKTEADVMKRINAFIDRSKDVSGKLKDLLDGSFTAPD